MGTGFRTNERGVASSIRSLDLDVILGDFKARGRCRLYRRSQARTHQEGCKVAPRDVSGMRVVGRLVSLIVCHGFSCNEFIAFGYPTASSNVWVVEILDSGPLCDRDAISAPEGGSSTNGSSIMGPLTVSFVTSSLMEYSS
jgi:hypothetical protein